MSQAILRTERIQLIPLSGEHLEYQVELDADPEVMRHLGGASSRGQAEADFRVSLAEADPERGLGYWAGFVAAAFAGYWILRPLEPIDQEQGDASNEGELGYRLMRRYWRQGLGGEGARELVRHGFEDLGLTRIVARTGPDNTASRATMTAAGLRYRRAFEVEAEDWPPDLGRSGVEYAISREQWSGGRGAS
ncbi:GNAT family N-acetyltransferase [Dactylosporangium sp. NPDC051485]|uniref:GNAT family N-acetyltransferase n=1 Tax=Dactylosporangium sp. NPDC051485 TaxID=3154846 RepID=UPI003432EC10